MSRRPDIDAGALTAALLQAVTEARAGQSGPSIEAIRERLALPLLIKAYAAFAKLSRAIRLVMMLVTRPRSFRRGSTQMCFGACGSGDGAVGEAMMISMVLIAGGFATIKVA